MNWKRIWGRFKCATRRYHRIVEEEYGLETSWSSKWMYHAEIRKRHRCLDCDTRWDAPGQPAPHRDPREALNNG